MTDFTAGRTADDSFADPDQGLTDADGVIDTQYTDESAPTEAELSARARTQRRLAQARGSMRDATMRARQSATFPSGKTVDPSDDSVATTTSKLVDQAQAYRVHILSGLAAVVALLVAVAVRRARAHGVDDDSLDLGEWHLQAEPVDE